MYIDKTYNLFLCGWSTAYKTTHYIKESKLISLDS